MVSGINSMNCEHCGNLLEVGEWPYCPHGSWKAAIDPNIHQSERVIYYEAPNGEISIPGRGDRPLHPKMAAAGYVRREAESFGQLRQLEKRKGVIHERSYYDKNSAAADRALGAS